MNLLPIQPRSPWTSRALASLLSLVGSVAAQVAPTEAEVRAELERLHHAFVDGGPDAYLARFVPDQTFLHERHATAVRAEAAAPRETPPRVDLHSYSTIGDHAVAVLGCGPASRTGRAGRVLAFRRSDGRALPVLAVDVPDVDFDPRALVCPFCNFAIGPCEDWLALPVATAQTAAVEGGVFARLGADLAVEFCVQVADRPKPAAAVVESLLASLRRGAPELKPSPVTAWDRAETRANPKALDAARADVDLGADRAISIRAVAMGRLAHVVLVRGSRAAALRHGADVERLLAAYRVLSTDDVVVEQSARSLQHHCGGVLLGAEYHNPRHGVVVCGPEGWTSLERCSGFLFEVRFADPKGDGTVRVRGMAPPHATTPWTEAIADRWLADLAQRAKLAVDDAADTGWLPAGGLEEKAGRAFAQRTLRLRPAEGPARELRLLLRADQLVVADGLASAPEAAARVVESVRSLSPLR